MAQRRMFSLKIVSSDAFLEMPTTSRELYFQLGMYADDDGFVNPKKIMRMVGASDDDLKVLLSKRFVLAFEIGVVVIKHWLINNLIRKDFYQPTTYIEEKKQLEIKENKAYTENVNNLSPQYRLGKDRLDNNNTSATDVAEIIKIFEIFQKINPGINYGNKTQRSAAKWLIKQFGIEQAERLVIYAAKVQGQEFAPTITTPHQLKEKLGALKIFADRQKNQSKIVAI